MIKRGLNLPQWYLEDPAPGPQDDFYLRAFWDLSTEREVGFGVGPIPWSKIVEYGELEGLDLDVMRSFVRVVREMDTGYLKWQSDEADKKRRRSGDK